MTGEQQTPPADYDAWRHRTFYPSMSEIVAKERAAEEVRRKANQAEIKRAAWFNAHPGKTVEDYNAAAGTEGA